MEVEVAAATRANPVLASLEMEVFERVAWEVGLESELEPAVAAGNRMDRF